MNRHSSTRRKLLRLLVPLLIGVAPLTVRAEDICQQVEFPPPMQAHMLANMRDHFVALETITRQLAEGQYKAAGETAEGRLGMSAMQAHGSAQRAPFMPEAMRAFGLAMHRAASRFAIAARDAEVTGDHGAAFGALSQVMQQDSEAVRANDANLSGFRGGHERFLQLDAVRLVTFPESCRNDHRTPYTESRERFDDSRYGIRGGADDPEVDRLRQTRDIGVGPETPNLPVLGIDRYDLALEACGQQIFRQYRADGSRLVARPDQGKGFRLEHRLEISDGHRFATVLIGLKKR